MNKTVIRQFILKHSLTRELFFFFGKRKTNLKKIDNLIAKRNIQIADKKADNVIVSLTSYGARIAELKYTLYSLVVQSVRPEKIIVNLAFEDEKYLNEELTFFEKYGVEFSFCKNTRSYKKLLPTLERFPNKCIVTTDDDMYYERNWLQGLYEEHLLYPNDVCGHLAYKIIHNNKNIKPYSEWIHNYKATCEDKSIFLIGCNGILYPSECFHKDILNENLYMTLAPFADDIWFYFMTILNGTLVRQVKNPIRNLRFVNPYREYGIVSGSTLTQQNVGENKNDIQFRNVFTHYGISEQKFIDYIDGKIERLLKLCPPSLIPPSSPSPKPNFSNPSTTAF